jgi:hypothetical protein
MAGTLTIGTLSDGTNSTSATNCIQGSAKAWVNFNGTTATIKAAFNVSSITKNATGDYTLNYTNALPDANYAPVSMPLSYTTSAFYATAMMVMGNVAGGGGATTKTTTQLRVMTGLGSNAGAFDHADVNISIFR